MHLRGTVLIVSAGSGLSRKPRPMVVVQASDVDFPETLLVVPLTSRQVSDDFFAPLLLPDDQNGLEIASRAMINRVGPIRKSEIGRIAGSLSAEAMERIDEALQIIMGLGSG
jgi:mRNA-degrading endonuclease toxin of MazEF toxin-antitoxin module